jgi:hypothetical protein
MKKIFTLLVMLGTGLNSLSAQTAFWSDNFETGAPTGGGTRTPEGSGGVGTPFTSYFVQTNGTTISQVVPFTGFDSSNYWAGEDHNAPGTGLPSAGTVTTSPLNELSIVWTGINISGKTNLSFKGLFAANSTNEPWDNTQACLSGVATTNTDYIIVQYRIDGGAYTDLIRFYNKGSATNGTHKYLFEDADANGCGEGAQITNAFSEFTKSIAGTGTVLDLQVLVFCEGASEEWGIDNFRLLSNTPLPLNITAFTATDLPAGNQLQWQAASSESKDFRIEQSVDGINFKSIGIVKAVKDQNKYAYLDADPQAGKVFYRLAITTDNEENQYSRIVSVLRRSFGKMKIVPNPASSSIMIKDIPPALMNTKVTLTDINGRLLKTQLVNSETIHMDVADLASGLYLVRFGDGSVVKLTK